MAAAEVAGVRRGCVAAFGTVDRESGTERLVVVAETRSHDPRELARMRDEIIKRVDAQAGMPPDRVEFVAPQTVPKTSSGKIRRHETRRLYESGTLRESKRPPWLQMARLLLENFGAWLRLGRENAGRGLRRAWTEFLILKAGVGGGLLIRLCPTPRLAARVARSVARLALWLDRARVEVKGAGELDAARPALLLAQPAGEMDLLVVLASAPAPLLLAEERLLTRLPAPLRFLLSPLLAPQVDGGIAGRVRQALEGGYSVLAFADSPVGTPAGRCRIRLEPIEAAREVGAPLFPVLLKGAAGVLKARMAARPTLSAPAVVLFGSPLDARAASDVVECREALRGALEKLDAAV
jgi:1-acyl-sn-glycerol-3-phosphate acyltransferase